VSSTSTASAADTRDGGRDHRPPSGRVPAGRRSLGSRRVRDAVAGYLFIAPQLLGWAAFVGWPIVAVVWYSLHQWNVLAGTFDWAGLANYKQLVHDPSIGAVLKATLFFSVGLVVLNLALALALAVLLNQKLRGTAVFRTIFFSPVVVSLVAWAIVCSTLLQGTGGLNAFLDKVGITGPNWLHQPGSALVSVILTQTIKNVGLNMVLFLAALQGVPEELYEAAALDGASRWRTFWRISFPLISPTVLLTSIITVVGSLQVFAPIQVLTAGGPGNSTNVLVYDLYKQGFVAHDLSYASTLGVLLFVIVLVLTAIQWQMRRKWVVNEQ
jgi:multiple sugar transport system permease protein